MLIISLSIWEKNMFGSGKKESQKGVRTGTATKLQDPAEQEKKQHETNMANAGVIIGHAMNSLMTTGVHKSVIAILETVLQWPSLIDKAAPRAFVPQFNATEINAEEVSEEDVTITNVSFSYSGENYELVSRIMKGSLNDDATGTVSLLENGNWVIKLDIVKSDSHDHFEFQDLNAFRFGTWIEDIVRIAAEIELHKEETAS